MSSELYDIHAHSINIVSREIYLHSYHGESDEEQGVEFKQATTFIKNLHFLDVPDHKPILIHLHTEGGCWSNGMAMFNSIQYARSKITMLAYSQASSMSGILLQAADLRVMMPDCYFMMHFGTTDSGDVNPLSVPERARMCKNIGNRMLQIFSQRAINGEYFRKKKGATANLVERFFRSKLQKNCDWFLTAEETVYYGLADGIIGTPQFPNVHGLRKSK